MESKQSEPQGQDGGQPHELVLCVDAGGTSCKAAIISSDGKMSSSRGDPCNVTTTGLGNALNTLRTVLSEAIRKHPSTQGESLSTVFFSNVWIGMAGYDRPPLKPLLHEAISKLVKLRPRGTLKMTSDIDLLPASLVPDQDVLSVIVLVVGTGSIAMNYRREGPDFVRTGRVGGWGRILGDDGSGYDIGREGVRSALRQCDRHVLQKAAGIEPAPFEALPHAVLDHFKKSEGSCKPETLLDLLLFPPSARQSGETDDTARTKAVAGAASVVLSLASEDAEAKQIVRSGAVKVAALVQTLVEVQNVDVRHCALVLGGGLMGNSVYREMVLESVKADCGEFGRTTTIDQPVISAAQHLLSRNSE